MAVDIVLTDAARALLARIRGERPGALSLVIGNGCCDSTAPFLFDGREVVVDAAPDDAMGEDSFSCEAELGMRFSRARMLGGVAAA